MVSSNVGSLDLLHFFDGWRGSEAISTMSLAPYRSHETLLLY